MFGIFNWVLRHFAFAIFTWVIHNRNTTFITNRDASPQLLADPGGLGSKVSQLWGTLLSVTADSATSVYRFFTIPSNAVIASMKMWCAAQGAATAFDIGVFDTTLNGGAVVPTTGLQLFAAAVDVSGAISGTDYRFSALGIDTAGKQLWDLLGLSADPSKFYDICVNVSVAVNTGGKLTLHCTYGQ